MKLKTFRIESGLGKHVMFTSLIKPLFDKHGKINIISSYDDIFRFNEFVENSWGADYFEHEKSSLKEMVDEIIFYEPYKSGFNISSLHIKDMYGKNFGVSADNLPHLPIDRDLKEQADGVLDTIGDKFFIVQFSGGQPAVGFSQERIYQNNPLQQIRNYPTQMASIFVQKLLNKYPGYRVIDFTLPNEPVVFGTTRVTLPYMCYTELCKKAKDIICIDSSLAHIAASVGKSAIVLWNKQAEATPNNFGWAIHENIVEENLTIDYDYLIEKVVQRDKNS